MGLPVSLFCELSKPMIVPPKVEVVLNQATREKPLGLTYELVVPTYPLEPLREIDEDVARVVGPDAPKCHTP